MTATINGSIGNVARTLEEYVRATFERRVARLEKRSSEVGTTEHLDLGARLDEALSEEASELVDMLVGQKLRQQSGVQLSAEISEEEANLIAELRAELGEVLAEAIQVMVDAVFKVIADTKTSIPSGGDNRGRRVEMTYCGVWREAEYRRGDTTTHKGSLWHCERDGTKERPGTSPRWTLMHKTANR